MANLGPTSSISVKGNTGKTGATVLSLGWNKVTTQGSGFDFSVVLPQTYEVSDIVVIDNQSANALQVFPFGSDTIDGGLTMVIQPAHTIVQYQCQSVANKQNIGQWERFVPYNNDPTQFLSGDTTFRTPAGGSSSDPISGYAVIEDFIGINLNTATGQGPLGLIDISSGAGAVAENNYGSANHPGVLVVDCGSTNAGIGWASSNGQGILFGSFAWSSEFLSYLPNLSNGTDRFTARLGFGDGVADPDINGNGGAFFRYCDNVNGGKWQACIGKNGTFTVTDTGVVADTGYHKFEIAPNANGTSIVFSIDGTVVATITTNIPTTPGPFYFLQSVVKSAGTTNRQLNSDYYWYKSGAIAR